MMSGSLFPKIKLSPAKKCREKYRGWSPTAMTNALKSVREDKMSVRKAAKLHNVPVTTLRDRVDGRSSEKTVKSGPDPLLTHEEEARLVKHITCMTEFGFGFTRAKVLEAASDLAVHLGKRDKSNSLCSKWFYKFLGRWPELPVVTCKDLPSVRAQSASPQVVDKYFRELKSTMIKYGLLNKPEVIYNLDEKGISTEVSANGGPLQAITPPRAASTTIIGCGNALGQQIPPYYVFAGKRMRDELLNGSLPGTNGTMTEEGWSNSEVFGTYLKEHFQKYAQCSPENLVLLLFDGHSTHITLSVIERAEQLGIILFVFPPHCSHIFQSEDVGCFGPLASVYCKESLAYLRKYPGRSICRRNICKISGKAYTRALSSENLRSVFRKAGVYPMKLSADDEPELTPDSTTDLAAKTSRHHPAGESSTSEETPAPADSTLSPQFFIALHSIDDVQTSVVRTHCTDQENGPSASLSIAGAKQNKGKKRKSVHLTVSDDQKKKANKGTFLNFKSRKACKTNAKE